MSRWYDNNPRNMINGRLAYAGAGAIGRGISSVGGAMSQYARLKYQQQRDKKGDENLADTNRTKIDDVAKTLTVYDDDCTTVLRVFQLLDQNGNPSTDSVCERKPTSTGPGDNKPVCP